MWYPVQMHSGDIKTQRAYDHLIFCSNKKSDLMNCLKSGTELDFSAIIRDNSFHIFGPVTRIQYESACAKQNCWTPEDARLKVRLAFGYGLTIFYFDRALKNGKRKRAIYGVDCYFGRRAGFSLNL